MAIPAAQFKAGPGFPERDGRLSGCGLPAIVIIEPRTQKQTGKQTP